MLTSETKRKIDNCRNILVGKIPDPKSQIDCITNTLIYKFMGDQDQSSIDFGGVPSFFAGEYESISWKNIVKSTNSNTQKANLYVEGLMKMQANTNLPPLFRQVFKEAFLPFRDESTIGRFLDHINEFEYGHSEELGNAFEYLLQTMSAQGGAGQFRTPRHIIDWMVEVLDPKLGETVFDPACGTAGFLISAFNHVAKQTKDINQRKSSFENFGGLDIDPGMVKIGSVNMYLHGAIKPDIREDDSLSSEIIWNSPKKDIILANPPFMTPKGGIVPHKLFGIHSNRAEVLFLDWIIEHLKSTGKAAVIVPEGIIFQSGTAYKQLRKQMVESSGLLAVVSLPAGVFNPYSGVKTSILILDKARARKTDDILFLKISSDGFDLGAQRRESTKDDLPQALKIIQQWQEAITNEKGKITNDELGMTNTKEVNSPIAQFIPKSKIAESGDYNLTGDRYVVNEKLGSTNYEMVKLGDTTLFQIESGGTPDSSNDKFWNGDIEWATLVDLPQENYITFIDDTKRKITDIGLKNSSAKIIPINSILISSRATIGRIAINKVELATNQGFKNIVIKDHSRVNYIYLANVLTQKVEDMKKLASGGTFAEISKTSISTIQIPLPPISVQESIVAEIEVYQQQIKNCELQITNLKSKIKSTIDKIWE